MGTISIQGQQLEVDLIIFDKDGTLVNFDVLWGGRTRQATESLMKGAGMPASFPPLVYKNLGFDPLTNKTAPDSPLSAGTGREIATLAMLSLYHHGVTWGQAAKWVMQFFVPAFLATPNPNEIQPLGDVKGKMMALENAGIHLALLTNDDKIPALETMKILGIADHLRHVLGADSGFDGKPAPDAGHFLCEQLGVSPDRTMMVGDSVTDMAFAENAGIRYRTAIAVEGIPPISADFMIKTIDELEL
jgi:phosphoglycolate phosphatase-like HAD superfamily hydrolase